MKYKYFVVGLAALSTDLALTFILKEFGFVSQSISPIVAFLMGTPLVFFYLALISKIK